MAYTLQALADIRAKLQETDSRIAGVESAGLTSDDVQTRVKAFVATLQARFDESYLGMAITHPQGQFSTADILAAATGEEMNGADKPLIISAWLDPAALESRLMQATAPYIQSGKAAIPLEKRPALLKRLDEERHQLLVKEEDAITELLANGHEVFRRANADPLVVLATD